MMTPYALTIAVMVLGCCTVPAYAQPFTLAIVGDTQFDWSCKSEETESSPYCSVKANREKSTSTQGTETNQLVIDRVNEVAALTSFKGLVINGDLTSFGSQDGKLSKFKKMYMNQDKFPIWPGLGNHDYENNINDCGAKSWSNWNYCGADMMQFLAGWLKDSANKTRFISYDVTKYSKNRAQAQGQRNVSGSLAYSWEIGDFHFVQLNNYPTYEKSFTRGYSSGVSSWKLKATSPATWIEGDFSKAVADNKKIILNWHDFGDIYGVQDSTKNTDYASLIQMMDKFAPDIKAIFVGHNHSYIGIVTHLNFPPSEYHAQAISVPVVYSGSPIWGRFIKADFSSDAGECVINIGVVNTATQYNGTTTDPESIPCD